MTNDKCKQKVRRRERGGNTDVKDQLVYLTNLSYGISKFLNQSLENIFEL